MCIQLPVGADNPGFRGANLAPDVDGIADTAQRSRLRIRRTHNVEIDLAGRVAQSCRQFGLNGALECEIQQGCIPAAMH